MTQHQASPAAALLARGRRTHGVYANEEAAKGAAYDLNRLTNGTPFGYTMALLPRMGKVALISYRTYQ